MYGSAGHCFVNHARAQLRVFRAVATPSTTSLRYHVLRQFCHAHLSPCASPSPTMAVVCLHAYEECHVASPAYVLPPVLIHRCFTILRRRRSGHTAGMLPRLPLFDTVTFVDVIQSFLPSFLPPRARRRRPPPSTPADGRHADAFRHRLLPECRVYALLTPERRSACSSAFEGEARQWVAKRQAGAAPARLLRGECACRCVRVYASSEYRDRGSARFVPMPMRRSRG